MESSPSIFKPQAAVFEGAQTCHLIWITLFARAVLVSGAGG